ncbi:hypothetical protein RIF29_12424 [Crotalaria pallida]|uniref:Uncharacterized protein n=1 Tax=Crotalaria pallida TaxID=3830 RepID=A0AAN9IN76_CROPI
MYLRHEFESIKHKKLTIAKLKLKDGNSHGVMSCMIHWVGNTVIVCFAKLENLMVIFLASDINAILDLVEWKHELLDANKYKWHFLRTYIHVSRCSLWGLWAYAMHSTAECFNFDAF